MTTHEQAGYSPWGPNLTHLSSSRNGWTWWKTALTKRSKWSCLTMQKSFNSLLEEWRKCAMSMASTLSCQYHFLCLQMVLQSKLLASQWVPWGPWYRTPASHLASGQRWWQCSCTYGTGCQHQQTKTTRCQMSAIFGHLDASCKSPCVTLLCKSGLRTDSSCFGQSLDCPWPLDALAQGQQALCITLFSCLSYIPLNYICSYLYTCLHNVARIPSLYINLAPWPHPIPFNIICHSSSLGVTSSSSMDTTPTGSIPVTSLQPSTVGSPLWGSGWCLTPCQQKCWESWMQGGLWVICSDISMMVCTVCGSLRRGDSTPILPNNGEVVKLACCWGHYQSCHPPPPPPPHTFCTTYSSGHNKWSS